MAFRSFRWLGRVPALCLATLAVLAGLPLAAHSERGPRIDTLAATQAAALDNDPSNARVIVRYKAGSALAVAGTALGRAQHANRLGTRLALPLTDGRPLGTRMQGLRGTGLSSRQLAARLAAQADVEWAVVDRRRTITGTLPTDPYYAGGQTSITPAVGQWYLRSPDATVVSAINAEAAWLRTTGAASITVAVLDTGVRFDHPDLAGKLWPGYDFVRSAISNDGDGVDADASDPGDWSTSSNSSWHGTQVSGLIGAASDNGIGMASVGRNVMVLPVRVLGKGGGYDSDIIAGMRWAAGLSSSPSTNPHPAKVINMSLGAAGSCSSAYSTAINEVLAAGVTIVVAAGNANTVAELAVNEPANCPGVIAVAGVRHAGTKVGYSSLGPAVTLAAPAGNCVNTTGTCLYPLLTTDNAGTTSPGANVYSDGANASLGTSFASPLVAGTAALMLSVDPTLTPSQIKAALQATARPFPITGAQTAGAVACVAPDGVTNQVECYCTTSTCGAGMLDAGAAVERVYAATQVPTAVISASPGNPTAGTLVTLDGSGSSASAGRSITAYQWSVTSGSGLASFSGATNGQTASLNTNAAGTVVVSLQVTDNTGATRSTTASLTIAAAPVVVTPTPTPTPTTPTTTGSSGGGGGAMGEGWLLGLVTAAVLLQRGNRRLRRRPATRPGAATAPPAHAGHGPG